jgi:dipeptidase E
MKLFLASDIGYCKRIGNKKIAKDINNDNNFLNILKLNTLEKDCLVVVANNPSEYEKIDETAKILFESLRMSNFPFKRFVCLDNRNKTEAKKIISNADLIFLSGGKIECQNDFFNDIKLKELLGKSNACVIGSSAGSMNMCENIYNYPETEEEINNNK